jgi:two-component system OmpR family response regulator
VVRSCKGQVKFIRWPAQADLRTRCGQERIPRLLIIEGGATPPVCHDPYEDWVRAPISRPDLEARVATLRNRLADHALPALDPAGQLSFKDRSTTLSATQALLLEPFVERFGEVVGRSELRGILVENSATTPTRNSLDLHVMRLRRRVSELDLVLDTAWGRGYLLRSDVVEPVSRDG